jgi:nascent polypeptide-associated complex subunit alpha|tara:strand:- start:2964 stop:3311 length:348 start_codon:yes stop_codon:yes gene_type:complete
MFPGLNPKKMQAMMKQMGIAQEEIDANKVIIEKDDGNIIINNPSIVKINMQGQENFQISGDISEQESENQEEPEENNIEQDIQTIMEKVGCLEQEARQALEKANGDLTEALLSLN